MPHATPDRGYDPRWLVNLPMTWPSECTTADFTGITQLVGVARGFGLFVPVDCVMVDKAMHQIYSQALTVVMELAGDSWRRREGKGLQGHSPIAKCRSVQEAARHATRLEHLASRTTWRRTG
eukprot:GHVO01049920.1.p2 GENE.GHVO01049920.1~~GHVO01049920.1.p2  ORF type:complete len:122 (-),score=7.12 GHVO01049920.1:743-1108(-)